MAKIALLLFVVAIMVSLQANEAHRKGGFDAALEKDLHKAETTMIQKDLYAKKKSIQGLTEVKSLSKPERMLISLEKNHKKKNMPSKKHHTKKLDRKANSHKNLNSFGRVTRIKKPPVKRGSVSIIQSILKDFGLNGGRD